MREPSTERPDTSSWSDADADEYTIGYQRGEAARAAQHHPTPLAVIPQSPKSWGFHDGWFGVDGTQTSSVDKAEQA